MKLLLSPHPDDETLWTSFTILRWRPHVAVVFDSYVQEKRGYPGCDRLRRRSETNRAMHILSVSSGIDVDFLGFSDAAPDIEGIRARLVQFTQPRQPDMVFAPAVEEGGHPQHNLVGMLAREIFQNVTPYMTYTNRGKSGGKHVPFEPHWALLKLKALACYESQIQLRDNVAHFMRDQWEYYQ